MLKKRIKELLVAVTFLAGLVGCSSAPKVQEFADTANSAGEVQRLATDMQTAVDCQVWTYFLRLITNRRIRL